MKYLVIALIILAAVTVFLFAVCFAVMYFLFFNTPATDRENPKPDPLLGEDLPKVIKRCDAATKHIKETYPYEHVSVRTDDGLTLYGDFYINENKTDKTILCVHGYNSSGYYDFAPMVEPILKRGYNCFLLNHRHYGGSEGKYTGFGIFESEDLIKWIELVNSYFPDGKIVLYGNSMGAATVMQASNKDLTKNVVGIIEDCGFTSCREEFKHVLNNTAHLPSFPLLNILGLLTKVFLKLDLKKCDSRKSVAETKLPMLFVHGDADVFVPPEMARECYEACQSEKELIFYEGATHAQSNFRHPEKYENDLLGFADRVCNANNS